MKTGARYDAPTQFAITTALLELIKEFSCEEEGLSIQLVNQAIHTAYRCIAVLSAKSQKRQMGRQGHCTRKRDQKGRHVQKPMVVDKADASLDQETKDS